MCACVCACALMCMHVCVCMLMCVTCVCVRIFNMYAQSAAIVDYIMLLSTSHFNFLSCLQIPGIEEYILRHDAPLYSLMYVRRSVQRRRPIQLYIVAARSSHPLYRVRISCILYAHTNAHKHIQTRKRPRIHIGKESHRFIRNIHS